MCLAAQATFRAGMEGWLKRMAALYSSERERRTFLINNLHHILGRYGEAALTEGPDVVRETISDPRCRSGSELSVDFSCQVCFFMLLMATVTCRLDSTEG